MIELYELRQFAAFAGCGTLSDAAKLLHLSQPALSRNMKKLEEELGVTLFTRTKNRLELNENGKYAPQLIQKIMDDADSLPVKIREFDRKNRTLTIGVCSPAPIWILTPFIYNQYPHMTIQTEMADEEVLLEGLRNHTYHLAVLQKSPEDPQLFARECGRESLMFALPRGHRFGRRKSLSFAEMNGENMFLMSDIGFWNFVRTEKMPDSRFLTQHVRFNFSELLKASSLPAFTSDLAEKYIEADTNRIHVPISDPEAAVTYYLVCRKEERKEFHSLFSSLKTV